MKVVDYEVVALRHTAEGLLRAVRGEQFEAVAVTDSGTSEKPSSTPSSPPILIITRGVNGIVPAGEPMFRLVVDGEPGRELLRTFDRSLRGCVRWREEGAATIEDELITLKDSLLIAAHAGATGALERGFNVYKDLFGRVLRTANDGPGPARSFAYGTYGPYWRAMQRSLREVSAVALDKLGDMGLTLAADSASSLCQAAFDAREIEALQEFLGLYHGYFWQVTDRRRESLSPEYLLVSLQNLIDLHMS
jgi:hypothetical protein